MGGGDGIILKSMSDFDLDGSASLTCGTTGSAGGGRETEGEEEPIVAVVLAAPRREVAGEEEEEGGRDWLDGGGGIDGGPPDDAAADVIYVFFGRIIKIEGAHISYIRDFIIRFYMILERHSSAHYPA